MKPTKAQTEALAELLSEPWDSPHEAAQAVITRWDQLQADRFYHGAMFNITGYITAVGPFTTAKQVQKTIRHTYTPVTFYTPEGWTAHMTHVDQPPKPHGGFVQVAADVAAKRTAR